MLETAYLLGLSPHTVTRDIKNGTIRAQRWGRRVLISRSEILRLAARNNTRPGEKTRGSPRFCRYRVADLHEFLERHIVETGNGIERTRPRDWRDAPPSASGADIPGTT